MDSNIRQFLVDFSHRISPVSGDDSDISYLFQRTSIMLFRFNIVLLTDSFVSDDRPEN